MSEDLALHDGHVVCEKLKEVEQLLGPGHSESWELFRKREPPQSATLDDEADGPAWLLLKGLAHRFNDTIQV